MSEKRALQIGVVGLGQCGGNFAAEFAARGYQALAINTSQTDLTATAGLDDTQRLYIGVDGLNGTGGAAQVGAECVADKSGEIESVVGEMAEVDALLLVGGLGGGTGGNLSALVELLAADERPVIAMGVLPATSERHTAKLNALQAVNGLIDAPFDALILVDNQKLYAAFANAGMDQFLHEGNAAVAQAFDAFNTMAVQEGLSPIRTYDPEELRQTLFSGGLIVFGSRAMEGQLSPEALLESVQGIVSDHEYLGAGYELEDAVVISAILVVDRDTMADTPATVFEDFTGELKGESGGAALHPGLYGGEVGKTQLCVMVGGLPLPGRMQELLEEASQEAERFATKKAPRKKLQKLDLSALGSLAGPPSTRGKGLVKSKGKAKKEEVVVEEAPLVDLDFDDGEPPVVEEEILDDDAVITEDVDFDK